MSRNATPKLKMRFKKNGKPYKGWFIVWPILTYLLALLLTVILVAVMVLTGSYANLITSFAGQVNSEITNPDESATYFASDYSSDAERQEANREIGTDIMREGVTLLQNDDDTLPLSMGARLSVFGQGSVDLIHGGGGAGSIDVSNADTLIDSLKEDGFAVNPTLTDFYTNGAGKDYRRVLPGETGVGSFAVNEVPVSVYTDEVKASFADYGDAAVVVIGRSGSESSDLPIGTLESGVEYLQLDPDELDMINMACENFDKVVVLLNTQNPVELGPLADTGVGAVAWVGAFGETGANAIGELLDGSINPSGHLVDTFAYDLDSAPSVVNTGDYTIANSDVTSGDKYMVYAEGIYVGYRYYETRYEDMVLNQGNVGDFDYGELVQYPFGYGMSYTDFDWSDFTMRDAGDSYEFTTTVTNTGDVAGKDVVQLYMQSPYTDYDKANGIEKSAVELVGYAKTDTLEPGESQTVTVTVAKESMKAYDADGAGTYIVDADDYYFAAGTDAHAALNNVLAAKGKTTADGMDADGNAAMTAKVTVAELDTTTYATSAATGETIENQFDDVDIRAYDDSFTYLSRSDWTGTWPEVYADGEWTAPQEFVDALEIDTTPGSDATEVTTEGTEGPSKVVEMIGEDYDDEGWTQLVERMSVADIDSLVRNGGYTTNAIESISLPGTIDKDGPAGISSTLVGGASGTGFPPEVVIAATWNDELAERFGNAIGEDSLALGVAGWYGPAANIHRSPYGGRAFEYFSEDPMLSGQLTAKIVAAAQAKGVIPFLKHFVVNDQETNRAGGAMFANEQSVRDIYLKPFETAIRDADCMGLMTSMNRIGARWSGGHKGLMTNVIRGEWGFEGMAITDQTSFPNFGYSDLREGLAAGTDLWLNSSSTLWKLSDEEMTPAVQADFQRAAKNVVYAIANSNAMNTMGADSGVRHITPTWQKWLWGIEVVVSLLIVGLVFLTTRGVIRRHRWRKWVKAGSPLPGSTAGMDAAVSASSSQSVADMPSALGDQPPTA
ncbi:glycoside hydrolase family 3 protein [Bifidobacterium eulemuris]|uniref:Beta-glucosidase n=2 Tax=Bifidobacterium eulemuris TaxID=1765219 RepID=A0A261G2J9_9BIFI|nr:glycoside hydrolase family 3 protein [Bifidobacterium eulemuris]OZG65216.1 beta-glucosidase [Bifidobacterium eulemuris]